MEPEPRLRRIITFNLDVFIILTLSLIVSGTVYREADSWTVEQRYYQVTDSVLEFPLPDQLITLSGFLSSYQIILMDDTFRDNRVILSDDEYQYQIDNQEGSFSSAKIVLTGEKETDLITLTVRQSNSKIIRYFFLLVIVVKCCELIWHYIVSSCEAFLARRNEQLVFRGIFLGKLTPQITL